MSASLTDIVQGMGNANAALDSAGWNVRFFIRNAQPIAYATAGQTLDPNKDSAIEFDVAVTAGSNLAGKLKGEGKTGAVLNVVGVNVKGEVEGEASKHQENVSRIRFTVLYTTYDRSKKQAVAAGSRR